MDTYLTSLTLLNKLRDSQNEDAWEEFIRIYRPYIYAIIRQMNVPRDDIEELRQQIFLKLWEKLPENIYDPDRAKFRTWLARITKNHVINYINAQMRRKDHLKKFEETEELHHRINHSLKTFDEIAEKEWRTYLCNMALDRVSEQFSGKAVQVFRMSLKGMDAKQIADQMDLKESTIYVMRKRVKERLVAEISRLRVELE